MSNKPETACDPLAVSEAPLPTPGWTAPVPEDPLAVLREDVAGLFADLAATRQALEERNQAETRRIGDLLLGFLEPLDAFERVFQNVARKQDHVTPQMKKWLANFRTVHRMIRQVLEQHGVAAIENLDDGFDPHWHKVADVVVDPGRQEGTIVEEVKRGYVWQEKVFRKAEVVVVRHTP